MLYYIYSIRLIFLFVYIIYIREFITSAVRVAIIEISICCLETRVAGLPPHNVSYYGKNVAYNNNCIYLNGIIVYMSIFSLYCSITLSYIYHVGERVTVISYYLYLLFYCCSIEILLLLCIIIYPYSWIHLNNNTRYFFILCNPLYIFFGFHLIYINLSTILFIVLKEVLL